MYPLAPDSIRARGVDSRSMPDEEPGLLGNLPRSRPGTRSDKRTAGSKPAARRSQAAKPGVKRSASAKAAAPKRAGAAQRTGSVQSSRPAKTGPATPDPAAPGRESGSGPLRSAAKVAGTGLRVAEGVTREVLRRLPRP